MEVKTLTLREATDLIRASGDPTRIERLGKLLQETPEKSNYFVETKMTLVGPRLFVVQFVPTATPLGPCTVTLARQVNDVANLSARCRLTLSNSQTRTFNELLRDLNPPPLA